MKGLIIIVLITLTSLFSPDTCIAQNQTELWGMTMLGGNGGGIIFKTDRNGNNQQVMKTFIDYPGSYTMYSQLCETPNGKLYGMTNSGGCYNYGVLFEYDQATNIYTKKIDFDNTNNGENPQGSLMLASNGKLYGATLNGGINGWGILFEYDPTTNVYTKKLDFDNTSNGRNPIGSLTQATNGKLYGMTCLGGINDYGVLYEFDPTTNVFTKKHDFDQYTTGSSIYGSLVLANNGKFYGITSGGGLNYDGVIFEFDPVSSIFIKKIDLNESIHGHSCYGSLIQASNGKLYGMTGFGGLTGGGGDGVLFEYNPTTNTLTKKINFYDDSNGGHPYGSLLQISNGKLYGMTASGGTNGYGILFEYNPINNTCLKKIDFNGTNNGSQPQGSLIQASNGMIYGTTFKGGVGNNGVLFEFNTTTFILSKKIDFNSAPNGVYPYGNLFQASNKKLYGMTSSGGTNNMGVLFEYDPITNIYTKKIDFIGTNGSYPYGSLIQASNEMLYGVTRGGGINDLGVLFKYDPLNNIYTKIFDFTLTINGAIPVCLINTSNEKLYGMTMYGGTYNYGVVFEFDVTSNLYTKKLDFNGTYNGYNPEGSLILTSNGNLYGMTGHGGNNDYGVLFEYNLATNTCVKKIDFNKLNGRYPQKNSLIEICNDTSFVVSFTGLDTSYCNKPIFDTLIGIPSGGAFTGPGITGNIFNPDSLIGNIDIVYFYMDINGCAGSYIQNTIVNNCEGINEINSNNKINLMPNPTRDIVFLEIKEQGFGRVIIFNSTGSVIEEQELKANSLNKIDLKNKSVGIYFFEIIWNNAHYIYKVSKIP